MNEILLFTDGSVNTQNKTGYGAYLVLSDSEKHLSQESIAKKVRIKSYENTSSTRLELQILLFALSELSHLEQKIRVYTDSQNIIKLPSRRKKLEEKNFRNAKNERLKNHDLYTNFYQLMDNLNCEFIKVDGHMASRHKNDIDRLFSFVDKASRNALRKDRKLL